MTTPTSTVTSKIGKHIYLFNKEKNLYIPVAGVQPNVNI